MSEQAFRELVDRVRPEVERRLRDRWNAKLRELRRHGPEVVTMASAARDLTLRGGKRFRATLVAAAYLGIAPRGDLDVALEAGTAFELLQTYLLVQDDWIDGDALRRGGPSVHAVLAKAYGGAHTGAAAAILASDLTWGLAVDALVSVRAPDRRVRDALRLLLRVHDDVVVGQQMDLMGRATDVEAMHALKTGSYTVRGPLALGATLAGASPSAIEALERYAKPLGVAFQLRDDLLGTFASATETGKEPGGDLRAGKRTALVDEAERRLSPAGRRAFERVLGCPRASAAELRAAMEALEACGARRAVERRLALLCRRAETLAGALPVAPAARAVLAGAAAALRWPRSEAIAPARTRKAARSPGRRRA